MRFVPFFVLTLLLLALMTTPVQADEKDGLEKEPIPTASSLRAALLYQGDLRAGAVPEVMDGSSRAIPLAFGLSAVLPGLGQAYNRQWAKAAVGLAAEAALVIGYTTWRQRGEDGRAAYQAFAQESWSPLRYADWLNSYAGWLDSRGFVVTEMRVSVPAEIADLDFTNPDGWSIEQQQAVNHFFRQIQQIEGGVIHPETGATFSHKLPFYGEQQYYELIGKYYQFAPGWSDYPDWRDEYGAIIDEIIDPERSGPGNSKPNIIEGGQFLSYASKHGDANTYLRKASRVSAFFIVNHVIAAVDAAVFAKLHNERISTRMALRHDRFGRAEAVASVQLRF